MNDVVNPAPVVLDNVNPVIENAASVVKHKLKINGAEEEVTQDELIRLAQQGRAGQRALKEKAEFEKELTALRSREKEIFNKLSQKGINNLLEKYPDAENLDQLLEHYLQDRVNDSRLSPEQKRIRELEEYQNKSEKAKQEELTKRQEKEVEQLAKQYETQILDDIQNVVSNSGLPITERTYDLFGHYMELAYNQGKKDITAAQVLPLVKHDLEKNAKGFIPQKEADLYNYLGKDTVLKLLQYHQNQANRENSKNSESEVDPIVFNRKPTEKKKVNFSDWRRTGKK